MADESRIFNSNPVPSVDIPENRLAMATQEKKYSVTEANIAAYHIKDSTDFESIDSAVNDSIDFLKRHSWNAWKFKRSEADVLRFGIVLDWPQYEGHLQKQADLIRKACDKIGSAYHVSSCGTLTVVAGGAHALYIGFNPVSSLPN